MPVDAKVQAVKLAMEQIEKTYGKGSIMKLGEKSAHMAIDVIPTGILPLDLALGVGGLPKGRIIEIYGPEASGKTTVCLSTIAEAQKAGGTAAFIDAEHALDPQWAEILGVKLDDLLISQPDTGEQALEIAETLIRSGGVDIIVLDSVAALVPRAEIEGVGRYFADIWLRPGRRGAGHCRCQGQCQNYFSDHVRLRSVSSGPESRLARVDAEYSHADDVGRALSGLVGNQLRKPEGRYAIAAIGCPEQRIERPIVFRG